LAAGVIVHKLLPRFLLLSLIFILANCTNNRNGSPDIEGVPGLPFVGELQAAIQHALQAGQGEHDLGISAAVSIPGYKIWSGVTVNSHAGVPVRAGMLFDDGSIAKNFEAALVLKLVENGELDLDAPISGYLPAYPNVNGGITIRQLLNHTSGVFNVFEHPDFPWVGPDVDYAKSWLLAVAIAAFVMAPYGPPGTTQHYASTNYLLLTVVVEKAAGISVPEEIERHFLVPLGLEHTFITSRAPLQGHFTVAHPWVDFDQDGDLDDLVGIPFTWKATLTHPVL